MTNSADPDQLASDDLDLHCFQRQDISGFSRTRVKGCYESLLIAPLKNKSTAEYFFFTHNIGTLHSFFNYTWKSAVSPLEEFTA